jgi:hypothetical protein
MASNDMLSLDPKGQFADQIASLSDGQPHKLEINIEANPDTPGQFVVQSLTVAGDDDDDDAAAATAGTAPISQKPITGNPAVDNLMADKP